MEGRLVVAGAKSEITKGGREGVARLIESK
jgi:hypothetical protein